MQVHLSANRRTGTFVVSYNKVGKQRKIRFGLVSLQFTTFSDSSSIGGRQIQPDLLGWCSRQDCGNSRLQDHIDGMCLLQQPREWLGDHANCACVDDLISILGGPDGVARRYTRENPTAGDRVVISPPLSIQRQQVRAIRADDTFDSWGIVNSQGRCQTCAAVSSSCPHLPHLSGSPEDVAQAGMSDAAWEKKMNDLFDYETGTLKIKALSSQKLPQRLQDDARLCNLITGMTPCPLPCSWLLQHGTVMLRSTTLIADVAAGASLQAATQAMGRCPSVVSPQQRMCRPHCAPLAAAALGTRSPQWRMPAWSSS